MRAPPWITVFPHQLLTEIPSCEAGYMAAPERFAKRQIPLAPRAPSIHGPSVWTGRALQAENDDLEKVGLALLYPASHDGISVKS